MDEIHHRHQHSVRAGAHDLLPSNCSCCWRCHSGGGCAVRASHHQHISQVPKPFWHRSWFPQHVYSIPSGCTSAVPTVLVELNDVVDVGNFLPMDTLDMHCNTFRVVDGMQPSTHEALEWLSIPGKGLSYRNVHTMHCQSDVCRMDSPKLSNVLICAMPRLTQPHVRKQLKTLMMIRSPAGTRSNSLRCYHCRRAGDGSDGGGGDGGGGGGGGGDGGNNQEPSSTLMSHGSTTNPAEAVRLALPHYPSSRTGFLERHLSTPLTW